MLLKVLSYWNLNNFTVPCMFDELNLKVLSYWNLNKYNALSSLFKISLKVLSYWNLNGTQESFIQKELIDLKYYHIGI